MDTADIIKNDWLEIVRVMSLVEGDGFEDSLPENLEIKTVPAEPTTWMAVFRFPDVIYSREPSTGYVVELRDEDGTTKARAFASDGSEQLDVEQPRTDPRWN